MARVKQNSKDDDANTKKTTLMNHDLTIRKNEKMKDASKSLQEETQIDLPPMAVGKLLWREL